MTTKGIPLKDILSSALVAEQVHVKGIDGLRALADEHAASTGQGPAKPTAIHIVHNVGNTAIDITLSNVNEIPAALLAIGYTKKGLLTRFKDALA